MKLHTLAALWCAVIVTTNACAEPGNHVLRRPPPDPGAQVLFDSVKRPGPRTADPRVFAEVYAKGLAPTESNVIAVQDLLARSTNSAVRTNLVRLLGSLYSPNDESKRNHAIAATLRGLVRGSDRAVALTALQTFARLGYQPDSIELLDYGLNKQLIPEDAYSQELALAVPLFPSDIQLTAASKLRAHNNDFGAKVLALTISNRDAVSKIAPPARTVLMSYLREHEPQMPTALGYFGLLDAEQYAQWLEAVSLLDEASGTRSYQAAVFERLNNERTDPRKILGFLTSANGKKFIHAVGSKRPFANAAGRAVAFAAQFPGHPVLEPMAQDLQQTLSNLSQ